jgi:Cys-tRNA(Pro) deacylase
METPVTRALDKKHIPYRFFQHPGPVKSFEQAARERGQQPEQIVRSLVFRLDEGEYAMVLVAGPQQVPWKALRRFFGRKRLTTASKEDVIRLTGYQPGSVSPFGLNRPMRVVVDVTVFQPAELSIGSGVRGTTVIMRRHDLIQALGDIETVDLSTL